MAGIFWVFLIGLELLVLRKGTFINANVRTREEERGVASSVKFIKRKLDA